MPRWVCPNCQSAKIAPSRPRRDDTRRYCLACSEKTGRLVARICPTLEQAAAARQAAEKAREDARQARRADLAQEYLQHRRAAAEIGA